MKKISIAFLITCLAGCFCPDAENKSIKGKPLPDINLQATDSSNLVYSSQQGISILFHASDSIYEMKSSEKFQLEKYSNISDVIDTTLAIGKYNEVST